VADPPEREELRKWTLRCKIHSKRPEEDAETTVMKAHESVGQQNSFSSLTSELGAGIEDNQNPTNLFGTNQWRGNLSVIYSLLGM
jgi:hypothetical protein